MIDKVIFGQLITELSNFYGKSLSDFVKKTYYKFLSEKLTTEEFKLAIDRAMFECKFFPTPNELIDFAKGNKDIFALEDYLKLIEIASGRTSEEAMATLSPQAIKTLSSLGGLARFKNESTEKLYDSLQTEFIVRWKNYQNAIAVGEIAAPMAMLPESKPEKLKEEELMSNEDVGKLWKSLKDIALQHKYQNPGARQVRPSLNILTPQSLGEMHKKNSPFDLNRKDENLE